MKVIQLQHDARLGASPEQAGPIPDGWRPTAEGATVLSFRRPAGGPPAATVGGLSGATRLAQDFGDTVCTYGLESDTVLAPLLLWDLAHRLPVGGTLTTAGATGGQPYLAREYYRGGLAVESRGPSHTTFRKVAPLTAEADRGLTGWTFGVPTGPGDPTGLNACVKRILELGVPEFEVVLCGRPDPGFKYFDRVRVVGEELTGPPVLIGKKKNVIAAAANYGNLCLLHDRVFLPRDFHAAVTKFGDDYPIATFQSVWFDDPYHLIAKRYSDYNRLRNAWPLNAVADADGSAGFYKRDLFPIDPACGFCYAHPLRYHQSNYCTGSLYLSKRSVWRAYPQSEALGWSEYEDVEQGLRASRAGVPSRVNPHAFTQSIFARTTILNPHILYDTPDGRSETSVSPLEALPFRRKPKIKWSHAEARERLATFAARNVPAEYLDSCLAELGRPGGSTADWVRKIAAVVYSSRIRFGEAGVMAFVADLEKYVVCDSVTAAVKRYYAECFAQYGAVARDQLVEHSPFLRAMLFYRPRGNLFYDSLAEYFPARTRWLERGTAWTARRLARHNGLLFALAGGTAADYEAAILNSTPFAEYYEAAR